MKLALHQQVQGDITKVRFQASQHPSYCLYTPTQLGARGKGGQRPTYEGRGVSRNVLPIGQFPLKAGRRNNPLGTGEYSSNFEKLCLLFFSLQLFFRKKR